MKERAIREESSSSPRAPCHGESADGKGPAAASLVDAWDQPALPTDLRSPAIRSGPALTDLYRSIVTGIDGTPMPSFAEAFTDEQRWEIVTHLATLRGEVQRRKRRAERKE
ncbi:MAG: c-type cytochrome [Verrucomicrobia bacterium]|nr:c-type cytochrome [Verrucomicrobiota bacterium]